MKLNVPEILKVQLVDDWEAVTKNNQVGVPTVLKGHAFILILRAQQLVPVPRNPTVAEVLQQFGEYAKSSGKSSQLRFFFFLSIASFSLSVEETHIYLFFASLRDAELVTSTIISGLQVYFDKSLGANLLYRFERPQYAEMRKKYITGPKVIIGQEKEMSAIYGAEHLLRMIGEFQFQFQFQFKTRPHDLYQLTFRTYARTYSTMQ